MSQKDAKSTISHEIIDSFSPMERKVIPFLNEKIENIIEKSGMDEEGLM